MVGLVALVGVALIAVGCGGSDGPGRGNQPPAGTGTVRGQVTYLDFPDLPATGVVVRVGTYETQTEDGWFEVNVPKGTYTVTVVPPEGFSLPPGAAPQVTVNEGETVTLAEPFVLISEDDNPPAPY